jgi:hypothetical protein
MGDSGLVSTARHLFKMDRVVRDALFFSPPAQWRRDRVSFAFGGDFSPGLKENPDGCDQNQYEALHGKSICRTGSDGKGL